ncbi:MAG: hypothetical protein ABIX10_00335 [Acidimicrobiales bacterium]
MTVTANRSRLRRAAAVAILALLLAASVVAPAGAGSVPVGDVELDPGEGGSTTRFALRLPEGASCPGDSANDGYRVNSYLVPIAVEPTAVTYNGTGPIPYAYGTYADYRTPLYDVETNSVASVQTANAVVPGEPGPIVNLPAFDFAVFGPGDLPAGRYNVGIACTLLNEIVSVWNTELVVTEAPDDQPAQIRWAAVDGGGESDASSGTSSGVVATVGLAGVVGLILIFVTRRRRMPQPAVTASLEDA